MSSDWYLHVWEETEVPQGLWQLRASKNRVPAAEKDQISKWMVAYFFTALLFFVWATDHCTGISSIGVAAVITAYSSEGTCAYKTEQPVKADERAVQKGPVWPAEVQRLGTEEWVTWQDKGFNISCAWWVPGRCRWALAEQGLCSAERTGQVAERGKGDRWIWRRGRLQGKSAVSAVGVTGWMCFSSSASHLFKSWY